MATPTTLTLPYLFVQGLSAAVDISLMGASIDPAVQADYTYHIHVPVSQLESVFKFDTGLATGTVDSGEPTKIVLSLRELTAHVGKNNAFVSIAGHRSVSDDAGESVVTPHGLRLEWLKTNNYEEILKREDMISEITSNIPSLNNLWGTSNSVFHLSNASIASSTDAEASALKALFYKAAAAGRINSSGSGVNRTWDLSQGDQLEIYLKYQRDFKINYEFATETFTNISDFTVTQLTSDFGSSVVVYFGDSATPVSLQDASDATSTVYRFVLTASG